MPDKPPYKNLERRGEAISAEMIERGNGFLSEIKDCFAALGHFSTGAGK